MRVLIVVHGFPPQAEGGSEIYVRAQARALARRGDEVLVLTREADPERHEYSVRDEERDGLRIMRINNTFRNTRTFEESYRNEDISSIARRIIDEFRPDVAHIHHLTCLSTLIVPTLAERGIPCFFTLHDYWLMCHRGQLFDLDFRVCAGPDALTARGESPAAFGLRYIPPGGVAPPSNIPDILGRRALPAGRIAGLGATPDSHHGLLSCRRCLDAAAAMPASAFVAARAIRALSSRRKKGSDRGLLRHAAGRIASALGGGARGASQAQQRVEHMRRISADVTRFLAPSRYLREQFIRFGIPADRIVHAPYGFDHLPFRSDDALPPSTQSSPFDEFRASAHGEPVEPRGLPGPGGERRGDGPLRLGFVGTLMVSKAPHLVIEAARRFDRGVVSVDLFGAQTAYHGDDSYRHQLAPLLASDGVRHHGPVTHDRIPAALASIDVLVVPSVWPENSPLVIHEAFLAGVPVIASRIGGIPELVEDGRNGLLFEPGDSEGLTRSIARLLREPGLLEQLRAGIGPVRTIDDDVSVTRQMYEQGIEKRVGVAKRGRTPFSRLAAVVLNYRTPDDTLLAVRSLLASRRPLAEIIVVENDAGEAVGAGKGPAGLSASAQREAVEPGHLAGLGRARDLVRVTSIHTGRNLGFSGGVNVGIRAALERGADAVLLVNSDVIVPPDCIERLERALSETPGIGIAGPVIAVRSAPSVVSSLGISYNPITGRMRHGGVGSRVSAGHRPDCASVDGVSGCFMLVTRDVFDAIGLFDEDYFFSFEDLDFCLRARRAGFETVLAGHAMAYHEGSRTIGVSSPERLYFAARNHLLLASRTTPASSAARHFSRVSAIVLLNLAHAAISDGGSWPQRIAAVVHGTRDYFLGRYGPGRTLPDSGSPSTPRDRSARRS